MNNVTSPSAWLNTTFISLGVTPRNVTALEDALEAKHMVQRMPMRAAAARRLGAETDVDVPPRLVDVAFECSGEDDAIDDAIAETRPGGAIVLVGIPRLDRTTFRASVARRKELRAQFSRRMRPDDHARAITLVDRIGLDLASLVTHRFDLSKGPSSFETLASRSGIKVVVEPS